MGYVHKHDKKSNISGQPPGIDNKCVVGVENCVEQLRGRLSKVEPKMMMKLPFDVISTYMRHRKKKKMDLPTTSQSHSPLLSFRHGMIHLQTL